MTPRLLLHLLLPTLVTVGTPRWHCTGDQCTGLDRVSSGHHKPTVWSSLSIPWHCLGNLGLRTIFIKCNIFILSTRLPFLLQHFVTGAVSHPAVVGHRTHKASSLVDDVLELLLFQQAAQGDGKAGGRQTEQRGELLRLTLPAPPSPYLPKLSAPPVTICEIWFSSFCEERERSIIHHSLLLPDGSSLPMDAQRIVICNHPVVEKSGHDPQIVRFRAWLAWRMVGSR